MKVYRIKHIPTGLFYQPVKGRFSRHRTNLGPNGKVYIAKKPTLKDIGSCFSISDKQAEKYSIIKHNNMVTFNEKDFIVLEYDISEKENTE